MVFQLRLQGPLKQLSRLKALAEDLQPEFSPLGRRRVPNPASSPLTSTHVPWCVQIQSINQSINQWYLNWDYKDFQTSRDASVTIVTGALKFKVFSTKGGLDIESPMCPRLCYPGKWVTEKRDRDVTLCDVIESSGCPQGLLPNFNLEISMNTWSKEQSLSVLWGYCGHWNNSSWCHVRYCSLCNF